MIVGMCVFTVIVSIVIVVVALLCCFGSLIISVLSCLKRQSSIWAKPNNNTEKSKKPKQSKVNKKKNSNIRIPFRYSYAPSHCKWKLLARTHTNILTMEMDVNVHARFTCCTLMWFRQSFVALLMRKCRFNGGCETGSPAIDNFHCAQLFNMY